jgi:hypothetical protein
VFTRAGHWSKNPPTSAALCDISLQAPCPTPKLEDHLLLAVRDCLINIFAAGGRLLHPQPEDAPCRGEKGPTYHGNVGVDVRNNPHPSKSVVFYYYWWGGTKSQGTAATSGLLYKPQMIDEDFRSSWWNEDWQGKPKYSEKTCPRATLSTTKSHMTRPGLEPRTAAVGSQRLTA